MKNLRSLIWVLAPAIISMPGWTASAALKCEMRTKPCIDGRTGEPRVCITTICHDDGEIVSIDTIVLKEGDGSKPEKPKLPRDTARPEPTVK